MVTPATSLPIVNLSSNDPASAASTPGDGTSANTTDFATALVQAHSLLSRPIPAKPAALPNANPAAAPNASQEPATTAGMDSSTTPADSTPVDSKGKEATDLDDSPTPTPATGSPVPLSPLPYSLLIAGLAQAIPVAAPQGIAEEAAPASGNASPGNTIMAAGLIPSTLPSSAAPGTSPTNGFGEQIPTSLSATLAIAGPTISLAKIAPSPNPTPTSPGAPMDSNAASGTASGVDFAAPALSGPALSIGNPIASLRTPLMPQSSSVLSTNTTPMGAQMAAPATAVEGIVTQTALTATPAPVNITHMATSVTPSPVNSNLPVTATPVPVNSTVVAAPVLPIPVNSNLATSVATIPVNSNLAVTATPVPVNSNNTATAAPIPDNSANTPSPATPLAVNAGSVNATPKVTATGSDAHSASSLSAKLVPANTTLQTAAAQAAVAPQTQGTTGTAAPITSQVEKASAATETVANANAPIPSVPRQPDASQRLNTLQRLQTMGPPALPEIASAPVAASLPGKTPVLDSAANSSDPTAVSVADIASATSAESAASAPFVLAPDTALGGQTAQAVTDKPALNRVNAAGTGNADGTPTLTVTALPLPTAAHQDSSGAGKQNEERSKEEETPTSSNAAAGAGIPAAAGDTRFPTINATGGSASASPDANIASAAERVRIADQVTRHLETLRLPAGQSEMSLRLHPEHLGSLHLKISVQGDGVVAHIVAESSQVQQALESQKGNLRAALEARGMHLNALEVSVGQQSLPDGRAGFNAQQNMAQQRGPLPSALRTRVPEAPTEAILPSASRAIGLDSRSSRLDYRA